MAKKPLPKLVIPPASSSKGASKLSYAQLRGLWIQAGGNPALASTMAAIALAESGGSINALNDNAATGDYSVGPWQINYYGDMRVPRTKQFGSPDKLRSDPLANAKAAVALASGGSGLSNWTTFTSGAYEAFFRAATPAEKAANDAALSQAKASNPAYTSAAAELSGQLALAKQTAHITDPWVTVQRGKGGRVTGFGESFGATPPGNVLTIGGQPATRSLYQQVWNNAYETTWEAYTGRTATPGQQADILQRGISLYTLRDELSRQSSFTSSPIYQQVAAGRAQQARDALGVAPPPDFIRRSIAQDWDAATFDANLRALPQYTKGPAFKANLAQNQNVYSGIYGTADAEAQAWLKHATLQGWTPGAVGQALRTDPAYKYSPEYQAKAVGFLDAIGQITGTMAVAGLAMSEAAAQQTAKSKVGGLTPAPLQISTVGG
jgi:lysozyme-like protein